jgi:hypothetical protein
MENHFPEQGMEYESKIAEVAIVLHWIDTAVCVLFLAIYF